MNIVSLKKGHALGLLLILSTFLTLQYCKSPTAPIISNLPDTTSQNFIWQKYYFGIGGYTLLNDVTIISDSSIWAVGNIYLNDSTGKPELAAHNAIHWDGDNWNILKIPYPYQGQEYYSPIQSVFSFNSNDVWFCGNGVIQWDGVKFNPINLDYTVWGQYQMNKIWGTSSNDLYIVGNGGKIAHHNNDAWQMIGSGTDMNIPDIWGETNPKTGKSEILAVASYQDTSVDRKVLQITGNTATTISSNGINWDLHSIWFNSQSQYYVAGTYFYNKNLLSDNSWSNQYRNVTDYYINCIRGNDVNDIVAVGAFGEVLHYNGNRWKSFKAETGLNGTYHSVAIKGNLIVAVGFEGQQAVILVGKR
jgi:hypothetical protein